MVTIVTVKIQSNDLNERTIFKLLHDYLDQNVLINKDYSLEVSGKTETLRTNKFNEKTLDTRKEKKWNKQ